MVSYGVNGTEATRQGLPWNSMGMDGAGDCHAKIENIKRERKEKREKKNEEKQTGQEGKEDRVHTKTQILAYPTRVERLT